MTPAKLVTSIITEVGIIEEPDTRKIEDALRRGGVSFEERTAPLSRRGEVEAPCELNPLGGRVPRPAGASQVNATPVSPTGDHPHELEEVRPEKSAANEAGGGQEHTEAPPPKPASKPDSMDADVLEFIQAIDDYKRQAGRPFPSWSEILEIVKRLGYEREA